MTIVNVDRNRSAVLAPGGAFNRTSQRTPAAPAAVLAWCVLLIFSPSIWGQTTNMENNDAPSTLSLPAVGATPLPPSITGSSAQNPFLGSTPQKSVPGVLNLSLQDALQRGLRYNLGLLLSNQGQRQAEGVRLSARILLLPQIAARTRYAAQLVDVAKFGIPLIPDMHLIVTPFYLVDAHGFGTQRFLDFNSLSGLRAQPEYSKAA